MGATVSRNLQSQHGHGKTGYQNKCKTIQGNRSTNRQTTFPLKDKTSS